MNRRPLAVIAAMLLGCALAAGAQAQPIQEEAVKTALTGEVTAVDAEAKTVSVTGANGEKSVFRVDDKTTIMSGSQKVGLAALAKGDWIAVDADKQGDEQVASYIEVVEDPSGAKPSSEEETVVDATIEVRHNNLSPATVQVSAGHSVTFHNIDAMPGGHTVVAADGSFSSPPLDKDESWSHSFDVPGVYKVRIKEHPGAEASIVVQ